MSTIARGTIDDRLREATGVDLDALTEEVRTATLAYERQKALCQYYDDRRKGVRAEEKEKAREAYQTRGEKVTEARLQDLGEASGRYRAFLQQRLEEHQKLAEVSAAYWLKRNNLDVALAKAQYSRSEMYHAANS